MTRVGSYVATLSVSDGEFSETDKKTYENFKTLVRALNKRDNNPHRTMYADLKKYYDGRYYYTRETQYLSKKPRLGKDNPWASVYKKKRDYQSIKIKHASRVDVYVYTRTECVFVNEEDTFVHECSRRRHLKSAYPGWERVAFSYARHSLSA